MNSPDMSHFMLASMLGTTPEHVQELAAAVAAKCPDHAHEVFVARAPDRDVHVMTVFFALMVACVSQTWTGQLVAEQFAATYARQTGKGTREVPMLTRELVGMLSARFTCAPRVVEVGVSVHRDPIAWLASVSERGSRKAAA